MNEPQPMSQKEFDRLNPTRSYQCKPIPLCIGDSKPCDNPAWALDTKKERCESHLLEYLMGLEEQRDLLIAEIDTINGELRQK